jgi:hypothetical protein
VVAVGTHLPGTGDGLVRTEIQGGNIIEPASFVARFGIYAYALGPHYLPADRRAPHTTSLHN